MHGWLHGVLVPNKTKDAVNTALSFAFLAPYVPFRLSRQLVISRPHLSLR
jgi:hypothetical protein